ncbi:MAG: type II secretion system F family protein [Phycisphaerae bacterium]
MIPGVATVLFFGAIIILVLRYVLISRQSVAMHVVATLSAIMRQNIPLYDGLVASAGNDGDKRDLALLGIANGLVAGLPLSEAIRQGFPKCPGHVVGMIAAAERIDQLPRALESIERDMNQQARDANRTRPVHPLYPIVVLWFLMSILGGFGFFVMPSMTLIFKEMNLQMPGATQWLWSSAPAINIVAGFLFLVVPTILIILAVTRFRPRRPLEPRFLSRVGDWIKWRCPGVRWFEWNCALARIAACLRLSLEAGDTVDGAISSCAVLDVNSGAQRRVKRWLDLVRGGQDAATAARRSGMGKAMAWAFDPRLSAGAADGRTPAILEALESVYRSRTSYAANFLRVAFWPCVILGLGAFVGLVVYACFAPVGQMIYQTLPTLAP